MSYNMPFATLYLLESLITPYLLIYIKAHTAPPTLYPPPMFFIAIPSFSYFLLNMGYLLLQLQSLIKSSFHNFSSFSIPEQKPNLIRTKNTRLVRSGYVNRDNGSARNLGLNGYNWSTTASPVYNNGSAGLTGYNLGFNASGVNPSGGPDGRWSGFPIRCLAY